MKNSDLYLHLRGSSFSKDLVVSLFAQARSQADTTTDFCRYKLLQVDPVPGFVAGVMLHLCRSLVQGSTLKFTLREYKSLDEIPHAALTKRHRSHKGITTC